MLFGLFNALASLQEIINNILIGKLNIFIIIYLNKILVHTEDLS